MPHRRWTRARDCALAGLAAGGAEQLVAVLRPHPLDPGPGALGLAGLAATGLLAGLLGLVLPRRGVALVWALVWVPELARLHGASAWLALVTLALVALPGRAALGLGLGGASLLPLLRPLPGPPVAEGAPGPVLVTVDTVRADSAFLAGMAGATAGCAQGTAVSAAPWTLPAVASLWTGLPAVDHGAGAPAAGQGWTGLAPGERGLGAHGAVTAVLSNPHLRPAVGFGAGLARVLHADEARHPSLIVQILAGWRGRLWGQPSPWDATRDARVTDAAAALLAADSPGLLWVHLLSPHEHARHDEGPPPGPPRSALGAGPVAYHHNIAWTAQRAAALVQAARDAGRPVLVVADHGESFGEDGHTGHGTALVDAQLLVPAVLCAPGAVAPLAPGTSTLDLRAAWLGGHAPTAAGRVRVGGLRTAWVHGWWPDALAGAPASSPRPPAPVDAETAAALELLGYRLP